MLLIGIAVRLVDDALRPERDFRALFFALALFPVVVKWELDVMTFLSSAVMLLVGPIVGVWLTGLAGSKRRSRPGQPSGRSA